mmetsp:Transcript_10656/g.19649  ORF Transcript_10656/g.19649 Transcript_10656/m.19649 type:complete len:203 (+) Transcript_10656:620-1228(+)
MPPDRRAALVASQLCVDRAQHPKMRDVVEVKICAFQEEKNILLTLRTGGQARYSASWLGHAATAHAAILSILIVGPQHIIIHIQLKNPLIDLPVRDRLHGLIFLHDSLAVVLLSFLRHHLSPGAHVFPLRLQASLRAILLRCFLRCLGPASGHWQRHLLHSASANSGTRVVCLAQPAQACARTEFRPVSQRPIFFLFLRPLL